MNIREKRIEKYAIAIFRAFAIIVFAVLTGVSLVMTGNNIDSMDEFLYFKEDSILGNLLGILLSLVMIAVFLKLGEVIAAKLEARFQKKISMTLFAGIVSVISVLFSVYWVFATATAPKADQAYICEQAVQLELGNIDTLLKGGYVAKCPHQLGIITFLRVLFTVFGEGNYKAYQYFSAVMVGLLVFAGFQIIKHLTKDNHRAEAVYLILALVCFPMYGYVPYVYGEIPSTAFVMLAGWMFLACMERMRWWKLFLLAGFCGAAMQFRQNTIIMFIGFFIVLGIRFITELHKKYLIMAGCMIAGLLAFGMAVNVIYKPLIPEDSKGIPSIMYIVMGTHESREGFPGWFDGTHANTYALNDYLPKPTIEAGKAELEAFAQKCLQDKAFAFDFYFGKMNTQWNAPMYQCLPMNSLIVEKQSVLAEAIYFGELGAVVEKIMNYYQLLIYGGVLLFLISKVDKIENYLLLIGIYGGFLFTLIWEAKTRYTFPYMVLMIPYAAISIEYLLTQSKKAVFCRKK
ncbi:MAG: glycosyltransferase family 39 protein [Lachnospiraceae bacterium]|nr:glycosyltransferase family 39 protein [Lachnospiraceae bacterium]